MHVRDCCVGGGGGLVDEVADAAVGVELTIDRHIDHFDIAVFAKNLRDVSFGYILGELLDHNLRALETSGTGTPSTTAPTATPASAATRRNGSRS